MSCPDYLANDMVSFGPSFGASFDFIFFSLLVHLLIQTLNIDIFTSHCSNAMVRNGHRRISGQIGIL